MNKKWVCETFEVRSPKVHERMYLQNHSRSFTFYNKPRTSVSTLNSILYLNIIVKIIKAKP